jgi:hypothetical protein
MPIELIPAGSAWTIADLRRLTDAMLDNVESMIAGCTDADVTFVPDDPQANDTYAASQDDVNLAWTLGHVIVHATASAEEGAFIGTELARGVQREGRSRYEVPWQSVTTIAQVRHRLAESRRMRLALLDSWPNEPHAELIYRYKEDGTPLNCYDRFIGGLRHAQSHMGQIAEIIRQAHAARAAAA